MVSTGKRERRVKKRRGNEMKRKEKKQKKGNGEDKTGLQKCFGMSLDVVENKRFSYCVSVGKKQDGGVHLQGTKIVTCQVPLVLLNKRETYHGKT